MANSNVGAKFLSVNLNKSYGQSGNPNSSATSGSSYGSGRGRVGGHGGGLNGGGMVVLSRPRSSHKPGPKLSVPPPLNLPSLRKEKKRFDSPQSGTSSIGGGASGSGPRPASSGSGWSKPSSSAVGLVGRDGISGGCSLSSESSQQGQLNLDGSNRLGTANLYMPPSARPSSAGPDTSVLIIPEKTSVLRGEDFPSLKATLVSSNGSLVKQKDGTHQKQQKEGTGEEISTGQRDRSKLSLDIDMHPRLQPSQVSLNHDLAGNGNDENHGSVSSQLSQPVRKQNDYFPAPLPLVSLSPRSDWADDERDISHGLTERTRVDHTHSKTEPYWETDFDFPRGSIFPHKPAKHHFDRRAYHDGDNSGKALVSEAANADPYSRDVRTHSREGRDGNSWRASLSKDGFNLQDPVDKSSIGARQNKYVGPQVCGLVKNDYEFRNTESVLERKDAGYGQGAGQNRNYSADLSNERGVDSRTNYRYKANSGPSSLASKSSGYQGHSGFDPLLKIGRDQRVFSRGEKPYTEGWESSSFDGEDPFSNGLFGVMRRKKDVAKQADFHDPVRESFEAELERVQKLQELERQRIIEEQERSIEMARREEEERQRIAREQEERQRRLEEEAVEAALREEHERLEAIRVAEEQKAAKEEERRRILMEEERRKEAARQKLQELEERIARRQAEATKADDAATSADERMMENEKMVERITNSASSDSSTLNRPLSMDTRGAHSLREGPFAFTDRGKSSSMKRNVFESTNKSYYPLEQADSHHSLRREALGGERTFPSKDFYGGNGHMSSSKVYYRGKNSEPQRDHPHIRSSRWNLSSDVGDAYGRNPVADSEFHEGFVDGFNDIGWGQGHSRGNFRSFADQMQQNPELDELYGYARPRFSIRQPRVLPPPSPASVHRAPFRNVSDHPGSSTYDNGRNMNNNHESRSEFSALDHGNGQEDMKNQPYTLDVEEEIGKSEDQDSTGISALRCDSQSSLSVSSPPHSPAHLSHDDLDESGDYLVETAPSKTNMISLPGNDSVVLSTETGKEILCTDSSAVPVDDDDEWPIVRNEELQEQEEYDEDEEGYHEEEEVHVRDDNVDLLHEFEGLHLGGKGSTSMMDNLVLGFDQGVEVGIPVDEYERSPMAEENSPVAPLDSTGILVGPASDVRQDEGSTMHLNDGPHMISSCTPGISMAQESVMQPIDAPHSSTSSDLLCYADSTSILPGPQSVPSSVNMGPFTSGPPIVSSSASTQGEAEAPVKLQFGLFSGPSLIPSPIPSIQIGSIQMPLQLHPQVGPSVTHMHPPQPHFFQFGQLRYPSPMSQGLLPLALQPMSFNQPNVQATYSLNQKPGAATSVHLSRSSGEENALVNPMEKPHNDSVKGSSSRMIGSNLKIGGQGTEHKNVALHQNQTEESNNFWNKGRVESGQKAENGGSKYDADRNANFESVAGASKGLLQARTPAVQSYSSGKGIIGSPLQGQMSGNKGRRISFTAGKSGQKLPFASVDASHGDSHGFQKKPRRAVQRMEFRVRQTADSKRSFSSLNKPGINAKSSNNQDVAEIIPKSSLKKEMLLGGSKQTIDAGNFSSVDANFQNTTSESKTVKGNGKDASNASHPGDGSLKRNIWTEHDVDPPLQSGVVRIFNQPGIEAPSDEDNFIEVRSKRQMLNDRREQRDKEIKAKSTNNKKVMQKHRSSSHRAPLVRATLSKVATSSNGKVVSAIHVDATAQKRELRSDEESARFSMVSPPLDPIGTPCVNTKSIIDSRSQSMKALQASSLPSISSCGSTVGMDLTCDSKKTSLDSAPISLVSLSNSHTNQEVMPLTQTQFDEAMHPAQYTSTSSGDCSKPISEPCMSTSSVLLKNTPFQSSTSPVSSLLAGEKIQFGAVTSPTALPHTSNHAASHVMGFTSSSSHSDLRKSENDSSFSFENKKQPEDSSSFYFEDCEAEAAASALVAAISNDDVAQNGLGTNSVSMLDAKNYSGIRGDGIPAAGIAGNHQTSEPKAEEPLTVSLPADLSVETPPISLWPPLQSPQSSSSPILSPFPGSTPLHLPFYDMNSMMGGPPVFAFGPHNEATGSQSQPQKSSSSGPGSLGTWQHCRTGMDSFYGPPAGYAGPFINQPGGVQGVQGQPHMLVYNHFAAPVGQFGQVGLSYMGTYIPSGKQPDWEHTPSSGGGGGGGEGEIKNTNMISAQDNPSSIKTHVQHLAMGSPLMPMPSHMAMFDVSPFQPSTSMSVQPHWSHVPPPPLQSIPPQSMPLPQQPGGAVITPQHNYGPADSNSVATNRLDTKPLMPSPCSDGGHTLAAGSTESASSTHFGNTLGLARDPPNSAVLKSSGHDGSNEALVTKDAVISSQQAGVVNKSNMHLKNPTRQQHQYNRQSRYGNQNGGAGGSSQNGSGAEWSNNRKMGFNGRNHPSGGHRSGFPPTKMKQIYVAKRSSCGGASNTASS